MLQNQLIKSLLDSLKLEKCNRKNCLSQNRDYIGLVWFGNQFSNKQMTCTSCFLLNDDVIKRSIPVSYNVLPLIKFNDKLLEEYKIYEQKKKSEKWHPLLIKNKKVQIMEDFNKFQQRILASLNGLSSALQNFLLRVQKKNKQIFTNQIFNEIIQINGKNTFEGLIERINMLINQLHYTQLTKEYQFQQIDVRNKKLEKQKDKVKDVIKKVQNVILMILNQIKKRNQCINKI